MTDGSSSGGGRPGSYAGASGSGNVPRRLSYASVASGATSQANTSNTPRSGAFAHMAAAIPNVSYPPTYTSDARSAQRHSQDQSSAGDSLKRQSQLPVYSRKYSGLSGAGPKPNASNFLVPSYLKDSRYIAKLDALRVQKSRSDRELRSGLGSGTSSATQSSSNASMHRIAPSHRGMTYEVIESNPPKDEDQLHPLPSKWNDQDRCPGLDLFNDGFDVKYNGSTSKSDVEAASVRADSPMSPECGIYYYEIEIKSKSKECAVAVGFSTTKASLERLPGWEPDSWAYHGDDGKTFSGEHNGRSYSSIFTAGDVIGCGINFNTGQAFFTKNGLDLGVAFRELKSKDTKLFPCVGIKKYSTAVVSVNFGQRPFVYDIDERLAQERIAVEEQIKKTKTTSLHPKLDETSLVQQLVAQFLMHGGYVETSKAFEEEVRREKRAMGNSVASLTQSSTEVDTSNATNRQQIRRAILAGDIDQAIDITNQCYPNVLPTSPDIIFHLKCQKWIELVSKAADLRSRQATSGESQRTRKTSNGFPKPSMSSEAVEDVFDQRMELDEDQQARSNGAGKATAEPVAGGANTDLIYNQLMTEAINYGQVLQREYRDSKDFTTVLQNIFPLMMYDDPRDSVLSHLLDSNGRVRIAEEVNSAILVSLGRAPTAALENTYKQTEALLDILGSDGGPASFMNLNAVFEQR